MSLTHACIRGVHIWSNLVIRDEWWTQIQNNIINVVCSHVWAWFGLIRLLLLCRKLNDLLSFGAHREEQQWLVPQDIYCLLTQLSACWLVDPTSLNTLLTPVMPPETTSLNEFTDLCGVVFVLLRSSRDTFRVKVEILLTPQVSHSSSTRRGTVAESDEWINGQNAKWK